MDTAPKYAYFRELLSTNQCELEFTLDVKIAGVGEITQQVKAVRQLTDRVDSLLNHIARKINNIIKTINIEAEPVEVDATLVKTSTGKFPQNTVLKTIFTQNPPKLKFSIFGQSFQVLINAPLVREIRLPAVLFSGITVQASRLNINYADRNKSLFAWYKSVDRETWDPVGNSYNYEIADEDVGHFLKLACIPVGRNLTGPTAEAVSEGTVRKMGDLPLCPFEKRFQYTGAQLEGKAFRVVSYNILSSRYSETNEHFPYCSAEALSVDYRKQLIAKELLGYQADIICLQEVDSTAYLGYFKEIFKKKGFMSFYHRKGNRIPEGLACIFNKNRFKKILDRQVVYCEEIQRNKQLSNQWKIIKGNKDVKECFLKQLTSLHVTVLKMRPPNDNHYVIVGNTHLYYHPEAEHIRVLQVNVATSYLQALKKRISDEAKNDVAVTVMLCGDFNCSPSSSVYDYLVGGEFDSRHEVSKKISQKVCLRHNFNFTSACGTPKYTNYTSDFKDCLDYIFIERDLVKVAQIVPLIDENELAEFEGLPNEVFPSDHLALVVDLELM